MDTIVTNFRKSKKDNWNKSISQDTWKNIYIVESSKTEFSGIGEDNENGSLYWIKGIIRPKTTKQ